MLNLSEVKVKILSSFLSEHPCPSNRIIVEPRMVSRNMNASSNHEEFHRELCSCIGCFSIVRTYK
jgi:hypothetical protein